LALLARLRRHGARERLPARDCAECPDVRGGVLDLRAMLNLHVLQVVEVESIGLSPRQENTSGIKLSFQKNQPVVGPAHQSGSSSVPTTTTSGSCTSGMSGASWGS